ncbi:MAG TPA: AAA family ATPase [Planctomycetaceae bacterium]|nr:AAA family ATPase [Planctomycetaceae bacterium]
MYESFFGLTRRPFSATPDPGCWFRCARYQAALDELLICAEQGQGIGILVAPAGAGKTLFCERLIREIGEPFTSVLLRHATYNTRRGFLQTLLCELAQPFDKHTDQELRLGLAPVLKGLHQQGRALLLVVDEAHQLSESLLEELRILADQAEDGQPIVRLVLAGQFGLEEKLAHPVLQALNQRVRAQVTLEPLSLAESADYVDFRITWGGGRTAGVFTTDAIQSICRAADGLPRCLNQLCDHALLLGYVNEQRPVSADTVAAALEDLRHLPLPWNLSPSHSETMSSMHAAAPVTESDTIEWESDDEPVTVDAEIDDDVEFHSFEAILKKPEDAWLPLIDDEVDETKLFDDEPAAEAAWDDDEENIAEDLPPLKDVFHTPEPQMPSGPYFDVFHEEPVYDRYNALDAGLEPPLMPAAPEVFVPQFAGLPFTVTATLFGHDVTPTERLDAIQDVLDAVHAAEDPGENLASTAQIGREAYDEIVMNDWSADIAETPDPGIDSLSESEMPTGAVFEFGGDDPVATAINAASEPAVMTTPETRSCRNLFTRLRRKQLGR